MAHEHSEATQTDGWNIAAHLESWRAMALVVHEEGLSELTLEAGDVRLTLKAEVQPPAASTLSPNAPAASLAFAAGLEVAALAPAAPPVVSAPASDLVPVASPMVGVFYRSLSPDDPPLIEVGDRIESGQTVGLVEAMKVFNEITSEVEGTVVEVRAGNAELVEPGSVLFLVRP